MTRYLYRVAFGISSLGNSSRSIEKIEHVLFETNSGYYGIDDQIKKFENVGFEKFKERGVCIFRSQVKFIAAEAIPFVPQTSEIKADIEIMFT